MSDTLLRLKTQQIEFEPITEAQAATVGTKTILFKNSDQSNQMYLRLANGTLINLQAGLGPDLWEEVGANGLVPVDLTNYVGIGFSPPAAPLHVEEGNAVFLFGETSGADFSIADGNQGTIFRQLLTGFLFSRGNTLSGLNRTIDINEVDGITITAGNASNILSRLQLLENSSTYQFVDPTNNRTGQLQLASNYLQLQFNDTANDVRVQGDYNVNGYTLTVIKPVAAGDSSTVTVTDTTIILEINDGVTAGSLEVTNNKVVLKSGVSEKIGVENDETFINCNAYADDAAAGAAGLTTGQIYQTNGSGAAPLNVAGIMMIKQ